eukprot:s9724_g1.t1
MTVANPLSFLVMPHVRIHTVHACMHMHMHAYIRPSLTSSLKSCQRGSTELSAVTTVLEQLATPISLTRGWCWPSFLTKVRAFANLQEIHVQGFGIHLQQAWLHQVDRFPVPWSPRWCFVWQFLARKFLGRVQRPALPHLISKATTDMFTQGQCNATEASRQNLLQRPRRQAPAAPVAEAKPEKPAAAEAPKPEPVAEAKPEKPVAAEAPKVEEPAPATEAPKIKEAAAEAPISKTEEPVAAEAPKVEEPAPATEAPKIKEAAAEAPKTEEPVAAEAPKVEAPKVEEAAAEAPKTEEPVAAEAPKVEEAEAPKVEEAAAEAPKTEKAEE